MALIGANELKRKMLITVDGEPYSVLEVHFASPSARGASTLVRTRLRHLLTGAVTDRTFKTAEKFAKPDVTLGPASFLYADRDGYHFMDQSSYDQFSLAAENLGGDELYLTEGLGLNVRRYNGEPIAVELPPFVELVVTETDPGMRGDAGAGSAGKPATLETGLRIRVPLFIRAGEKVRVSTATGDFASRA